MRTWHEVRNCSTPNTVLDHAHNVRCAMVLIVFAHFMIVTAQITPFGKSFTQPLLLHQGVPREGTTGRRCYGHMM